MPCRPPSATAAVGFRQESLPEYKIMGNHKWYEFVWRFLHPAASFLSKLKFNYSSDFYDLEGPVIFLSNHVTDWDPIMISSSFKHQMYFVASEDILRHGFSSALIKFFFAPIGRQKGGSAAGTVKAMLRVLKEGHSVALFPEGNRSWDGKTGVFLPTIGKLVRTSGCSLVTFRLSGGYLSSPRWSGGSIRRGKMSGAIVNTYSPEQLRAMTPAQINSLIAEDLSENAYTRQREEMIPYKGKNLAEGLETYLFACPECGAMHKLAGNGNRFRCGACGAESEYSPEGFLRGGFRYDTIEEWGRWQEKLIASLCETAGDKPVFSDDKVRLCAVTSGKRSRLLGEGTMTLYRDRLELPGGIVIPLDRLDGMATRGAAVLFIGTSEGNSYELSCSELRCMKKYQTACTALGCPVGFGV